MSYELTIKVETLDELIEVVGKLGDSAIEGDIQVSDKVKNLATGETAKKARAPRGPKKTDDVKLPEVGERRDPFAAGTPASTGPADQQNVAGVQQSAPATSAPVTPAFDRNAAIARANALVGELKATGIKDEEVMPQIHQVYEAAGADKSQRIGLLADDVLARFMPLFEQKVLAVKQQVAAAKTPSYV